MPLLLHNPPPVLSTSWDIPTPALLPFKRSVTLCPELPKTARGVQKHNLTLSKGQISHSACLWALGTKATEFTSINWALAFVLGNGGLGVGPSPDQPLLERTVRGSQTSGLAALWLMYPRHVTLTAARIHTLTCIHTSPSPQHSLALHHTIPPDHIKRKSPQLPLKSNGFRPQRWHLEGHRTVVHGWQNLHSVHMNRIPLSNWKCPQNQV